MVSKIYTLEEFKTLTHWKITLVGESEVEIVIHNIWVLKVLLSPTRFTLLLFDVVRIILPLLLFLLLLIALPVHLKQGRAHLVDVAHPHHTQQGLKRLLVFLLAGTAELGTGGAAGA